MKFLKDFIFGVLAFLFVGGWAFVLMLLNTSPERVQIVMIVFTGITLLAGLLIAINESGK